jgi:methionyl aminopeptidase
MITRKTRDQIALMRRAARSSPRCTRFASAPQSRGDDRRRRRRREARPSRAPNFLGYGNPPFLGVVCASPNEVIVHGIPPNPSSSTRRHPPIDCGAIIEGWHGDAAITVPVGDVDDESKRLLEVTRAPLEAAIEHVTADNRLGDIGAAVEGVAERPASVVREYVGHGIGTAMHEEPQIPNYGPPGRGLKLKEGMVLAIEPMVNAGGPETELLADGWTVVTRDRRRSAHFEHTIAVSANGPEVLTLPW